MLEGDGLSTEAVDVIQDSCVGMGILTDKPGE